MGFVIRKPAVWKEAICSIADTILRRGDETLHSANAWTAFNRLILRTNPTERDSGRSRKCTTRIMRTNNILSRLKLELKHARALDFRRSNKTLAGKKQRERERERERIFPTKKSRDRDIRSTIRYSDIRNLALSLAVRSRGLSTNQKTFRSRFIARTRETRAEFRFNQN